MIFWNIIVAILEFMFYGGAFFVFIYIVGALRTSTEEEDNRVNISRSDFNFFSVWSVCAFILLMLYRMGWAYP